MVFADSFPKWLEWPGLGQVKASSQELCRALRHDCQGPKYCHHHFLPPGSLWEPGGNSGVAGIPRRHSQMECKCLQGQLNSCTIIPSPSVIFQTLKMSRGKKEREREMSYNGHKKLNISANSEICLSKNKLLKLRNWKG